VRNVEATQGHISRYGELYKYEQSDDTRPFSLGELPLSTSCLKKNLRFISTINRILGRRRQTRFDLASTSLYSRFAGQVLSYPICIIVRK
jgi:hypothetical protein